MKAEWHWRPRLKQWQLITTEPRQVVIKGKTAVMHRRVDYVIYCKQHPYTVQQALYEDDGRFIRMVVRQTGVIDTELTNVMASIFGKVRMS